MNKFRSKIGATKATTASSKSDRPVAQVTDDIREDVDAYIANKAELKRLEAEQKEVEARIRAHVREQYIELGFTNQFTKSMDVPGTDDEVRLVCTHTDRFSVPQDEETLAAIKKLIGKKFETLFNTDESISIKKTVLENEKLLDKIATACEKAGLDIASIFDRTEKVVAVDALDQKQFTLPRDKFETFCTLVRQAAASLK